ncbi:hypothetical protein SUNI508_07190 [Seiridium unicorne]|uniref:Uncharacterized protein n=1 Tax=Seiridium unicorne TaxID=138068 RepID=A0ABR2UYD4_9PEZI
MTAATPKAAPKPMPTLAPEDSPREDALEESNAVPEVVAAVLEEYDIVPRGVLVDESTVLVEDNAPSTKGWTDLDSSRFTVPKSKAFGSPGIQLHSPPPISQHPVPLLQLCMKFPLLMASPVRQNCGHASDLNVSSVQVPRTIVPFVSDGCVSPV